jgi:hypothetical protein
MTVLAFDQATPRMLQTEGEGIVGLGMGNC